MVPYISEQESGNRLIIFKIRSYFLFKNSRIIRFPFYIRGRRYIKVGNNLTTGYNCRLDAFPFKNDINLIEIGNDVQINDYVHIASIESVKIGNNVLIASKVFITDHNHGNYSGDNQDSPLVTPNSRPIISKPVIIEDNVITNITENPIPIAFLTDEEFPTKGHIPKN